MPAILPLILLLRSLAFNLAWYGNLIVQMVGQAPIYFFLSRKAALGVCKRWCRSNHVLHRWLAGTQIEITGTENILESGCIVASKHQSIWEFYALFPLLRDPSFVLKSELMQIPIFGWYVAKVDQIPIRRGDKGEALRHMLAEARAKIAADRQILIFPEGTRRKPGAEPNYRYGVTRMYLELQCPVVPVALDSGLYWPRRKFWRYPGTLRARFLEPIMPGLSGDDFAAELERRIEEGCVELYRETVRDPVHPPLPPAVQEIVGENGTDGIPGR